MNLREWRPIPGLEDFVERVWLLEVPAGGHQWHRVFPDGRIDITFGLRDRVLRRTKSGQTVLQPRACVIGQRSEPLWLEPTGSWRTAGIRLRPEGAYAVLNMNLAELSDSSVPLDELWGPLGKEIVAKVSEARTATEALRQFQEFLLERLRTTRRPHPGTVRAVQALLDSRGQEPVHRLARSVGWSERTLERRFSREVGLSPKRLAQTVRFQSLLASASAERKESWASLAWDCGFADQAHLTREVRRFAGASPTKLEHGELALARLFLSRERLRSYFRDRPG